MARVRFLAPSADPRPDHVGVVYGPLHETDIVEADYEYVIELRRRGMVEIIDATGLPEGASPETAREPFVAPTG